METTATIQLSLCRHLMDTTKCSFCSKLPFNCDKHWELWAKAKDESYKEMMAKSPNLSKYVSSLMGK